MSEPTREQLARFMCVRVLGPGFTTGDVDRAKAFLESPVIEESWREQHAEFQRQVKLEGHRG